MVVDKNEARLKAAREIGAHEAINVDEGDVKEKIGTVDFVFDAVGCVADAAAGAGDLQKGRQDSVFGNGRERDSAAVYRHDSQ